MQVNFTQPSCVGVSNLTRFVGLGLLVFLVWVFFVCVLFFPETSLQSSRNISLALLIKMNGMNKKAYIFFYLIQMSLKSSCFAKQNEIIMYNEHIHAES